MLIHFSPDTIHFDSICLLIVSHFPFIPAIFFLFVVPLWVLPPVAIAVVSLSLFNWMQSNVIVSAAVGYAVCINAIQTGTGPSMGDRV